MPCVVERRKERNPESAGRQHVEKAVRGSDGKEEEKQSGGTTGASCNVGAKEGRHNNQRNGRGEEEGMREPAVAPEASVRHAQGKADGVGIGENRADNRKHPEAHRHVPAGENLPAGKRGESVCEGRRHGVREITDQYPRVTARSASRRATRFDWIDIDKILPVEPEPGEPA